MPEEKITKPDVVITLTEEQEKQIASLVNKRKALNAGLIFGSVGLSGETIALSFIPQKIGAKIRDLAYQELGGDTDAKR